MFPSPSFGIPKYIYIYIYVYTCAYLCIYVPACPLPRRSVFPDTGRGPYKNDHQTNSGGNKCSTSVCMPSLRLQNSQCLAKSRPCAGPSAGTVVARLQKWHVWRLLVYLPSRAKGFKLKGVTSWMQQFTVPYGNTHNFLA